MKSVRHTVFCMSPALVYSAAPAATKVRQLIRRLLPETFSGAAERPTVRGYRREIDGLRALAVLPVVLFHAGFRLFHGGFVGVDVFFVISGYLITSILIDDLKGNRFSVVTFYERRARRILPALFTVMAVSTVFACLWMLPDELKNFGQSIVATALSSNNMLLAHTSGYWALASEFKPLLHTWSLGVEEQYYLFYPLLLFVCWYFAKQRLALVVAALAIVSYGASILCAIHYPSTSFFILPTRAWELFVGALVAMYCISRKEGMIRLWKSQLLSGLGILLIALGVLVATPDTSPAQLYIIVPVAGAILVVLFASPSNLAGRFLGSKCLVGLGLISYSFYLWHQPFFAYARIFCKDQPSQVLNIILIAAALVCAYASWRYIERPFRRNNQISRSTVFQLSLMGAIVFVGFGLYLNASYGMLARMYDPRVAPVSAMDKRVYNERVFAYKKTTFSGLRGLRVLVVGNSHGRDFVNMTTETFDTRKVEIVYRDDFSECIYPFKSTLERTLYLQADIIVFATWNPHSHCFQGDSRFFEDSHKDYFYIGTKGFGYNLSWVVRLKAVDRPNQLNRLPPQLEISEREMQSTVPERHFISLLSTTVKNEMIPITDEKGYLISTDRTHVTRFGAIYFGQRVLRHSRYGDILLKFSASG